MRKGVEVSILCLTYNHAKFIEQTLDSFLAQETEYTYEVLINDDASTDGTQQILQKYQKKYPNIVKPIFQKNNLYSAGKRNFIPKFLMPIAQGKYLAICEGDDYWTDTKKIQTQVDFLKNNPDYVIHSGNALYKSSDKNLSDTLVHKSSKSSSYKLEDFIDKNNLITCTVLFRNLSLGDFANNPNYDKFIKFGDWSLYLAILQQSGLKAFRSSKIFAAYRVHSKGIYSSVAPEQQLINHKIQLIYNHHYLKNKDHKIRALKKALEFEEQRAEMIEGLLKSQKARTAQLEQSIYIKETKIKELIEINNNQSKELSRIYKEPHVYLLRLSKKAGQKIINFRSNRSSKESHQDKHTGR